MKSVFVLNQPVGADGSSEEILVIGSSKGAHLLGKARFGSHWKHVPQNGYDVQEIQFYESIEEVLADPKFSQEDRDAYASYLLRESGKAKLTDEEREALGIA